MDGIFPCSTGHHSLLGPLPWQHLALALRLIAGQGYRWLLDAFWRLVLILIRSTKMMVSPKLVDRLCWIFGTVIFPNCQIHVERTDIVVLQNSRPRSMPGSDFSEAHGCQRLAKVTQGPAKASLRPARASQEACPGLSKTESDPETESELLEVNGSLPKADWGHWKSWASFWEALVNLWEAWASLWLWEAWASLLKA